jgi:hypothetical protein
MIAFYVEELYKKVQRAPSARLSVAGEIDLRIFQSSGKSHGWIPQGGRVARWEQAHEIDAVG